VLNVPASPSKAPRRKLSRTIRRQQIIEATIETLAVRGYSRTTLTDVAKCAGLSQALVNFHFETKDTLLADTLGYLSEEYRLNWYTALERAGPDPALQLDALLRADFSPAICTHSRLAAWCAFWGEVQSRPLFQEKCTVDNEHYSRNREAVCSALLAAGRYTGDPVRIARVLRTTAEGVWSDLITMATPYNHREALATVHCCAAAFFPRHFNAKGLLLTAAPKRRRPGRTL
jgi:TetR/AcrR family transcriptional repressor of bet genes